MMKSLHSEYEKRKRASPSVTLHQGNITRGANSLLPDAQKLGAKIYFRKKSPGRVLTWSPARAERETAFALAFPESLPALPPACEEAGTGR